MTKFTPIRSAVCIAALLSGTSAMADVTAAQVWDDWKANLEIYGEDGVTIGSEDMSGDTLTVTDLTLTMQDEYSTVTADMGNLTFTEQGDGTVAVGMADSYDIDMTFDTNGAMTMNVTQSGLEIIVSGTPEEMNYALTADQYGISIDEIKDGEDTITGDMRFIVNNVNGNYVTKTGDLRNIDYALNADSIDMLMDIADPNGTGNFTFSGKLNGLTTEATMAMPLDANFDKPEDLFKNGFAMSGGYAFSDGSYIFDADMEGEQVAGTVSMGSGTLDAEMDGSVISYDTLVNDVAVSFSGGEIPFPIDASVGQYGIGFTMPLAKTDEPTDFGMRINLTDLAVNDMIWSLIDPTGALPHDPATVKMDLSGTGKLFFDLLDPAQAEAMAMSDVPGELNSLDLNDLTVSIAGAEVNGTGGFTFDNTDLTTFDGMPRPTGEVNIDIVGANALMDKLVAMGLLPEDQAMMGRMMMGMFARSTGDDQLSSKIEINDEGHVMANGQRLQ